MSKDESKKKKKKKKESKKKSKVKKKDRSHHQSEAQVHERQEKDVANSDDNLEDDCNSTGDGNVGRDEKSIPIKLSVGVESKSDVPSSNSGGWSWGAAFAVASTVQPEEDLDDNFLMKSADNSDDGKQKGFMDISQLANDHSKVLSNNDDTIKNNDAKIRNIKRNRSDSSMGSGDDDNADGNNSVSSEKSDDVPLEGRMVPNPIDAGDMILVLVDTQSGTVYSSGERDKDGKRVVIGKVVKGEAELDPSAMEKMKQLDGDEDTAGPSFPYPTNPDDHCETPLQSYKDIVPILKELCKRFGVDKSSMKIYDPYFCDGSVVKHLSSLGFSNVYNKKEDCYAVWKASSEPEFHVFITNPPYSEDHIDKLMRYVTSPSFGNKPWLLLMPQWVHKKDYYVNATTKNKKKQCNPFYIVPQKRYVYLPPANFREKKDSDVHKKSSPFVSM